MLEEHYKLINDLEPFIISANLDKYDFNFRVNNKLIDNSLRFNPLQRSSSSFIDSVYSLDRISFGNQNMGMDKWVFYDCAVMPGAVFGFSIHRSKLTKEDLQLFGHPKLEYIPLSMYIAIPTLEQGAWFGHNLCSLNNKLSLKLKGLGYLTKFFGINVFNPTKVLGATQWNSNALGLHLKFGPLKLLSALSKIHSKQNTLTYECFLNQDNERYIGSEQILQYFKPNEENLSKLQAYIENGATIFIHELRINTSEIQEVGITSNQAISL